MTMMNLKNQLRLYMEYQGIGGATLARKTGLTRQNISDWLGGRLPRDVRQIKKLAVFFGTSVDHLCFGEGLTSGNTSEPKDPEFIGEDWFSGVFEVKIRRIKS